MQTPVTGAGEPNSDNALMHLLTEIRSDGDVVQYFVCFDCLDLIERKSESIVAHECLEAPRPISDYLASIGNFVQAPVSEGPLVGSQVSSSAKERSKK